MIRIWATIAIAVLCASALFADAELAPGEVRIPLGESREFEFGPTPVGDTTVLLELLARMDAPGLGGSMFFMEIEINGEPIIAAKTRTVMRLVNKAFISQVAAGVDSTWHGGGGWRVLYAPDFEKALKQTFYEDNPYRLVLDVTDTIDPLLTNSVKITNTATAALAERVKAPLDLVIGKASITTKPGASPTVGSVATDHLIINRGEPAAGPAAYTGKTLPGGGFALTMGDNELRFDSAFSYPNAGLNHLVAEQEPNGEGQPGWTVQCSPGDGSGVVTASGPDYTVRRTVRFTARRVEVSDEITNAHADAKLGMMVQHSARLKPFTDVGVRLAGNPDPAVDEYHAPANPSVHIAIGDSAVGLICEDDVFRNQARLFFEASDLTAGLRTEMLCLQPGETYTLRWSVYPVAGPDYYDFINLVREDWGSNYTVEGAWCFFVPDPIIEMPVDELRARLDRLGVNYACSWGGWVDGKHDAHRIGFGSEVMSEYWADYRDRLRQATAKLHEARPGIKVLIYYDSQRDTHENSGENYPDSLLTNASDEHQFTEWGGRYSRSWSMVATLDNSFGKDMLDVIDCYMDEIGADGLYWDEMENVAYGYPLITYALPDGHSCILNEDTWTIDREVGITTLLGATHRMAVVDKVRAKGGTVMGNGPSAVRGLLERKVQRMVEIQHNERWAQEGNLDSTLGYASSRPDFGNVTRALGMATLLVGTRTDYEYDVSPHEFPFTPVELHHGYLLGKERIITLHSGSYGWPDETVDVTVRYFDAAGKLRLAEDATAAPGNGRVKVELGEGEVCIIERK